MIIYLILHIKDDSMVPVSCKEALKFRFYMYLKEEHLYSIFNLFFAIEFFAVETNQKIAPR